MCCERRARSQTTHLQWTCSHETLLVNARRSFFLPPGGGCTRGISLILLGFKPSALGHCSECFGINQQSLMWPTPRSGPVHDRQGRGGRRCTTLHDMTDHRAFDLAESALARSFFVPRMEADAADVVVQALRYTLAR